MCGKLMCGGDIHMCEKCAGGYSCVGEAHMWRGHSCVSKMCRGLFAFVKHVQKTYAKMCVKNMCKNMWGKCVEKCVAKTCGKKCV